MQIASFEIDVAQAGLLVSNAMLVAAACIWLLLITGVMGRIALLFEELTHGRSAVESQVTTYDSRPTAQVSGKTRAQNPEPRIQTRMQAEG